jgi:methionyl-tRNA formyltransferase
MKILFFGTPDFSLPTLKALIAAPGVTVGAVFTQPDRPSGRGGKVAMSPIKELAVEQKIPVFQPTSLRKEFPSIREEVCKHGPFDLGVVIAFGQILPKEALTLPTHGCVNIHASLLPRWRGAAPIQRAIQAGDVETGICLMRMDEGLDTGSIYSELRTPIEPSDTGGSLHDTLSVLGAEHLTRSLAAIVSGELAATPQPDSGVTYASKITADECKIDWELPAVTIARTVRALSPWPGCFTTWRGKRVKILFAAQSKRSYPSLPPAGTIAHAAGDRLEIVCGGGTALLLNEVQLEGKKRMRVDEFLRGSALPEGEIIGH